jgi:hypothetical protein
LLAPGQSRTPWSDPPRLAAAGVVLAGAAISLWLNLPGHFSYDSVVQLAEGRAGAYSGEHPPVMSWLLGVADQLQPGAAPFVLLDTVLIHGALLALVMIAPRPGWLTALAAGIAVALPQLLVYPGVVWKDVLFAGAACAGFVAMAAAATWWDRRGWRLALTALAVGLLTLAALARQNGAVILPFAAFAFGWIAATRSGANPRRGLAQGLVFLGVTAALTLSAISALSTRLDGTPALAEAWEGLQTYDLVGAAARDPDLRLGVAQARAPWLVTLIRTTGVQSYSPAVIDSIEPALSQLDGRPDAPSVIAAQWRGLILRHPLLYLRERGTAFRWVFLTPEPEACPMVFTGIEGPPEEMAGSGLTPRRTLKDQAISDYGLAFVGTPAMSHALFAGAGLIVLAALLRRRQPADIAVAGLLVSALAFAATFVLISIACDYRYLYALDMAAIGASIYALPSWPGPRRP